jgi:AcrR family transcriptional regulator
VVTNGSTSTRRTSTRGKVVPRKEKILAAAIELFRTQGFHAVGMDEIGANAGITGPGVYRHFPNKDSLLVAIFDRVANDLHITADAIVAEGHADELARLVRNHTAFTLDERAIISVYMQEEASLPPKDRRRLRRGQRAYVDQWVQALCNLHPDLNRPQAVSLVQGVIGYITSVTSYQPRLDRVQLESLLAGGAMRLFEDPPLPGLDGV